MSKINRILVVLMLVSLLSAFYPASATTCNACENNVSYKENLSSSGDENTAILTSGITASFAAQTFKCYTCWKKVCCKGYKRGFCRGWCMGAGTCCN